MRLLFLVGLGLLTTQAQPRWEGTWVGTLTNSPAKVNATEVEVIREIGPFPTVANPCSVLRTTYRDQGTVRAVKDYQLCRAGDQGELVVDEGNGIKLASRLLGDVLVSAFKVKGRLLVSQMRLRHDELEEEIFSMEDSAGTEGVVSLRAISVQTLRMRRAKEK